MREALGALSERRHHVEGKIERRLALAVEPATYERSPGSRKRGERPSRIVGAVAAAGELQAKPPRAKWSRYARTAIA